MTDDLPASIQIENSLICDVYSRCLDKFEDKNDQGRIVGEVYWWKREETNGLRFQLS